MNPLISFPSVYKTQPFIFHSSSLHLTSSKARNRHHNFPIHSSISMESSSTIPEIAQDYSPFLRIYKDGRVERLKGTDIVPPSLDPVTKVRSKDVVYSPQANLSARIFIPEKISPNQKLPLLIYYHGGGFVVDTPFSPQYHNSVNTLVAEANVVAVSVDYRRAPEDPLPIGYDDSWTALKWVASHFNGGGTEDWLTSHADFGKVFLAGDSAGANIAHQMAIRNGQENLVGINVVGIALIHPYFWGTEPIGKEAIELEKRRPIDAIWYFACPTTIGCDDPFINPISDPKLGSLGCNKVLVMVAENDVLRDRGWLYYEKLRDSGWGGTVEIMEAKEEDHVFHLENSSCENAAAMLKRIASFINEY